MVNSGAVIVPAKEITAFLLYVKEYCTIEEYRERIHKVDSSSRLKDETSSNGEGVIIHTKGSATCYYMNSWSRYSSY